MDRRSLLKRAFAGLFAAPIITEAVASAPVVASCTPEAVLIPYGLHRTVNVCLMDARYCYNFKEQVQNILLNLESQLPPGKWKILWVNLRDRDVNPFGTIGQFFAVPGDPEQECDLLVDHEGFFRDLKSVLGKDY